MYHSFHIKSKWADPAPAACRQALWLAKKFGRTLVIPNLAMNLRHFPFSSIFNVTAEKEGVLPPTVFEKDFLAGAFTALTGTSHLSHVRVSLRELVRACLRELKRRSAVRVSGEDIAWVPCNTQGGCLKTPLAHKLFRRRGRHKKLGDRALKAAGCTDFWTFKCLNHLGSIPDKVLALDVIYAPMMPYVADRPSVCTSSRCRSPHLAARGTQLSAAPHPAGAAVLI